MATARKSAGDFTGRTAVKQQSDNKEALAKRAQEISIMAEIEAEELATPIDYSEGPSTKQEKSDELEVHEVELEEPTRTIIPNTNLESVTFGAGNHYTFNEGRKYVVSADLARHLKEKGYLWEGSYR